MDQKLQKSQLLTYLFYSLGVVFLVVLYRTAWISDDAYISYRSIENFVTGHGFTFNPGIRVQAYTHPLWAFLHIPFRYLFENMYLIGLFISMATSIAFVVVLILKSTQETGVRIFLLAALISSAAFMDFSTSGLENPLTNLLIILAASMYLSEKTTDKKLLVLSLLAGLMLLNRMDSILLIAPLLFLTWWRQRSIKAIFVVLLGLSPFLFWEIIALIYYGFPFPLTAYAKLNVSLGRGDMIIQGFHYFQNFLTHDPISAILLLAGIIAPFTNNQKKLYPLLTGIVLYLLYILYIGGGFMQGRFFCGPLVLALIILANFLPKNLAISIAPVVILLSFFSASPPLLSHAKLGTDTKKETQIGKHGIANERLFYFPMSGLISRKEKYEPSGEWVSKGKDIKEMAKKHLLANHQGFLSYFSGPSKHIIDGLALTDPFLAQLPNVYRPDWRPGHNQRLIPRGYLESLASGKNQLVSSDLQKVYDGIQQITTGPIWTKKRFQTIWDFNLTDTYSQLIDQQFYTLPIAASIPESDLPKYTQGGLLMHPDAGFEIKLHPGKPLQQLQVWLQKDCSYTCAFRLGDKIIRGSILDANSTEKGVSRFTLSAPSELVDNIILYPNSAAQACQVHDVKLGY